MIKRLTRTEPEPPWSALAAIGAIFAMFAALLIGTTIAQSLLEESPQALMTGWSIGMILAILFVMVTRRRSADDMLALRIGGTKASLPLIALWGLGFAILLDLISALIIGNQTLATAELLNFTRADVGLSGWLIALIFMVGLQPIGEELVFRGLLFPTLRSSLGPWAGLMLSAAFHAMFHFIAYPPSPENQTILLWYGLILPFLDALVFASIRAMTGSTRAAMVAHAAFGLFAVVKVFTFTG